MGFLKNIFNSNHAIQNKENVVPEYHKCPICGEMVKTNVPVEKTHFCYLDGEPMTTTKDIINSLQFCEHCGYIYEGYDYEFFGNDTPTVDICRKQMVLSEKYQNIFNSSNIEPHYKKLLLYNMLGFLVGDIDRCELYYEYKYHFENNNMAIEQKLLEEKLICLKNGTIHGFTVESGALCYKNRWKVHISENEIMGDLLRRLGRFNEAREIFETSVREYQEKGQEKWGEYEYFLYELELIEAQDKRHI